MDWIPRSLRQKQKKIDAAMSKIEAETGKAATDEEIAAELGISLDELNNWQGQAKMTNLVSLDEFTEEGTETAKMEAVGNARFEHPEEAVEKEELKKMIVEALDTLTEKEREVMVLYYYEEMMKEIQTRFHTDGTPYRVLKGTVKSGVQDGISLCTLHSLKGLEFKVVILMDINERKHLLLLLANK